MTTVALGPAPLDITGIRAGDRNLIQLTLLRSGVPMNLTGMTVKAQARKAVTDAGTPALEAEVLMVNATGGVFTIRWDGEEVRTLMAGAKAWKGVWDLQSTSTGEDPVTLLAGKFEADMDVTR
jgi:hypothetical protein